jgi:hypothetical protein
MKIKELLNDEVRKLLTDDSLDAIQEAFDAKTQLTVETTLQKQDELYAEKLETLINTIDRDHSSKMQKLVEAIDTNNAKKLMNIVKKYENGILKESKEFKGQLISSISDYCDEFLKESLNQEDFSQAVKNKTAFSVLANLREVLAVDSVMMKESVKEAIVDGKSQMDKLAKENTELKTQFKALYESNEKTRVNLFLEKKTSTFNDNKKKFIRKALEDKSSKFIEENFDYTVRLFDKQDREQRQVIKESALDNRKVKPDFVKTEKVITEKVNNTHEDTLDPYVQELSRTFGMSRGA